MTDSAIEALDTPVPSVNRIVAYTLTEQDAAAINQRRFAASKALQSWPAGNMVMLGDVFPLIITRAWGARPDSEVSGQVFLDGNDTHWVQLVSVGEGPGHFAWPRR